MWLYCKRKIWKLLLHKKPLLHNEAQLGHHFPFNMFASWVLVASKISVVMKMYCILAPFWYSNAPSISKYYVFWIFVRFCHTVSLCNYHMLLTSTAATATICLGLYCSFLYRLSHVELFYLRHFAVSFDSSPVYVVFSVRPCFSVSVIFLDNRVKVDCDWLHNGFATKAECQTWVELHL